MKKLISTIVIVSVSLLVTGCAKYQEPYSPYNTIAAHHASKLSSEQIGKIIKSAASKRGWACNQLSEHTLRCTIHAHHKHEAVIDINYDSKGYSIKYVSSKDLATGDLVHRNYNRWVKLLERDINRALERA
jgi:hypothetical protein